MENYNNYDIFLKPSLSLERVRESLRVTGKHFFSFLLLFLQGYKEPETGGEMFILIKRCNLFCKQKTSNPNQTKHCLMLSDATLTALCTIYPEIYLTANEPFWNIDNVVTGNVSLSDEDQSTHS